MRPKLNVLVAVVCVIALAGACSSSSETANPESTTSSAPAKTKAYRLDSTLRLNQIQVLGSHNSYHGQPYPELLAALEKINTATAAGLDYGHKPIAEQFALGVRQFELDISADPDGGKFANPTVPAGLGIAPPDPAIMNKPGFKVVHQADIDTNSTCLTFVLCLRAVKTWSDANPGHVPIMIDVEMKDPGVTAAMLDAVEAEIRTVMQPDDLITPDLVRGTDAGLGHAVSTKGWPTLGEVRGRVMFMLDNESLTPVAREGHPSLRGRILFTASTPGADDAAVSKLNDPIADAAKIKAALAANMMVRTRADADTLQARTNDTAMREAALSGGAQWVSTDYEVPNPKFGAYVVKIPGGTPARCNPVTAPPNCTATNVEDPDLLAAP